MNRLISKIAVTVLLISAICWLGAVNIRALIGTELVELGTLNFMSNLDPAAEREIYRLVSFSSVIVAGTYFITAIAAILFLCTTELKLKEHGWLFMSVILFFMFVPLELFVFYLDFQLFYVSIVAHADLASIRYWFIERITALAGAPIVALLCYYTIIGLVIWKPLRKDSAEE